MRKPKRIAHFIETDIPGGAEQVLLDLCEYSRENANIEPVIVTFPHPWFKEQCDKRGLTYLELPFRHTFKRTILLPLFALQFSIWLKRQNIDLLHSHLFGPITGSALAAFVARIPHVGTLHDIYMVEEKPSRIYLIRVAAYLRTYLVTVSKNMEAFYRNRSKFTDKNLRTIYNGIDTNNFVKSTVNPDIKKKSYALICVGRLIPLKQIDKIIESALAVLKNFDVTLTILGEGPEKERLLNLIPKEHKDKIIFLGLKDDVNQWLEISDIFIQYSTTEGLSRSILEALASGLPCIVSNVGGNAELVKDQINGFLVPANDTAPLVNAIEKLIENPEIRIKMGNASAELSRNQFDREQNNRKYLQLYSDITKGGIELSEPQDKPNSLKSSLS